MADNLRTEYDALCSSIRQIVTYRFTVLGFFLATVGLVLKADDLAYRGFILMVLAVLVWLLDIRNRVLLCRLEQRGNEIQKFWNSKDAEINRDCKHSFVTHGKDKSEKEIYIFLNSVKLTPGKSWLDRIARHSLVIDVLMLCVFVSGCGSLAGFGDASEITADTYRVLRIVDGDTFKIRYDGDVVSVRIIGIDAPERNTPQGPAATAKLTELIDDREVRLVFCGPRRRDNFGRLLARVFVAGGAGDIEVGPAMIAAGCADPYRVASSRKKG